MAYTAWHYLKSLNGNVQSDTELPDQLKSETDAQEIGIPYAWGGSDGFDTASTSQWNNFFDAINKGAMTGNINFTDGYKSGTAGIDCSGFVQSSLKIPGYKQSTNTLDQYLKTISFDDLRNMDVLLWRGEHVAFFQSWVFDDYGNLIGATTLESTDGNSDGTGQKVKEYYRSKDDIMNNYIPMRFNYVGSDYIETNSAQPTIENPLYRQAINKNDGTLDVKWDFNDTASGGYQTAYRIRVYKGDINGENNMSGEFVAQVSLNNVVIASGNDFPDGLSGVTLAKKLNAPLLLVDKNTEDEGSKTVLQYILSNLSKNGKIYILGGEGAVSSSYVDYFKQNGYSEDNIIRIGGQDRDETSVKIAENLNLPQGTPVVISNDSTFADALSISPKAGFSQWPVLLTSSNKLNENTEKYIEDIKPSAVYIVGGTGAISENVKNKIKEITGLDDNSIIRLGGKDRYETVEKINNYFYKNNLDKVYVAYGENFPDSLSGSAVAAIEGKPLVLVSNLSYVNGARSIDNITRNNKVTVNVFGGDKIVTNYLISKVNNICLKLQ